MGPKHLILSLNVVIACLLLGQLVLAGGSYRFIDVSYGLESERITAIAVHPRDGDVAFVGADGQLYKTDDGGESWRIVLSFRFGLSGEGHAGGLNLLGDDGEDEAGYRRDSDFTDAEGDDEREDQEEEDSERGEEEDLPEAEEPDSTGLPEGSWSVEETPIFSRTLAGVRTIVVAPEAPDTIYAATPMGLFRSLDRGETFQEVPLPSNRAQRDVRDVAIHPRIPTQLVIATKSGAMESSDGGYSWRHLPGRAGRSEALCAEFVGNRAGTLLVGTTSGLFRTDDGGRTFLLQLLTEGGREQPISDIAYDKHKQVVFVGTGRRLYVASDEASIYHPLDIGARDVIQRIALSHQPHQPAVVAGNKGLYRVDSEKGLLDNLLLEGDVPGAQDVSLDARRPQLMWVATQRGLFRRLKGVGGTGMRIFRRRLEEVIRGEPTVDEVATAAIVYARLDHTASLETRSSLAAALPQLQIQGRHRRRKDQGIGWGLTRRSYLETLDELADTLGDIYDQEPEWQRSSIDTRVMATARWNLDELVFQSTAARIAREEKRIASYRRKVYDKVVRVYSARRRILRHIVSRRSRDQDLELKRVIKLLEYTAMLDAMTGGFFSEQARERGGEALMGLSYDGTVADAAKTTSENQSGAEVPVKDQSGARSPVKE